MRTWTKLLAAGAGLALAACGLKASEDADEKLTAGFGSAKVFAGLHASHKAQVECVPGIVAGTFKVRAKRVLDSHGAPVVESPITVPPHAVPANLPDVSPDPGVSRAYEFRFDTLRAGTYEFSADASYDDCGCVYEYATRYPVTAKVDPKPAPAPKVVLLLQQGDGVGQTCPPGYMSDVPFFDSILLTGACGVGEKGLEVTFNWKDADDKAVEWHAKWREKGASLWADFDAGISPPVGSPAVNDCTTPPSPTLFCGDQVVIPNKFPPVPVEDGDYELLLQVTSKRGAGNDTPPHMYGLILPYKCTHENGSAEVLLCMNPAPVIDDLQATNVADSALGANFGWPLESGQKLNIVATITNPDPLGSELTECFWSMEEACLPFLEVLPYSSSGKNCPTTVTLSDATAAKAAASPGVNGRYCKLTLQVWDVFATFACGEGLCSSDPCYDGGLSCQAYPGQNCGKGGNATGDLWLWVGETSVTFPPVMVIWASTTPQSVVSAGTAVPMTIVVDPGDGTAVTYEWTLNGAASAIRTVTNPNVGDQNYDTFPWTATCTATGTATFSVKLTPDVGPGSSFEFGPILVPVCP